MADELGNGPDRPGSGAAPGRRAGVAVGAIVLAVLGVLALRSGVEPVRSPDPRPTGPPPTVALSTVAMPTGTASPLPQVPALRADEVCPLVTDRRTVLTVSFRLVNASAGPVTLELVEPFLPFAEALRPAGVTVRSGSCAAPGAATADRTLVPRAGLLVSFRLALTGICPTAAPVQATVRERTADDRVLTERHPLFNDLGSYRFDDC